MLGGCGVRGAYVGVGRDCTWMPVQPEQGRVHIGYGCTNHDSIIFAFYEFLTAMDEVVCNVVAFHFTLKH